MVDTRQVGMSVLYPAPIICCEGAAMVATQEEQDPWGFKKPQGSGTVVNWTKIVIYFSSWMMRTG